MAELHGDAVIACADLVGRAGAIEFQLGWDCPHTPDESDDHNCPDVVWYAHATYKGARIMVDRHRTPTAAAMALAERMLSGAACRCRRPVTLSDEAAGCRWQLMGKRWEPGCDVEPVRITGDRGDHAAMQRALAESGNRAQRRATRRGRRGGGRRA